MNESKQAANASKPLNKKFKSSETDNINTNPVLANSNEKAKNLLKNGQEESTNDGLNNIESVDNVVSFNFSNNSVWIGCLCAISWYLIAKIGWR